MTYRVHPYAELFPLMTDAEFDRLCADISVNGQLKPIDIYNETILDGRNRYNACLRLKITPKTQPCFTSSPLDYVMSVNDVRRHLTASQRAMIAAKIKDAGRKLKNEPIDTGISDDLENEQNCTIELTDAQAANLMDVSRRSVAAAHVVRDSGTPELITQVEQGKKSVSTAVKEIRKPKAAPKRNAASVHTFGPKRFSLIRCLELVNSIEVHANNIAVNRGRVYRQDIDSILGICKQIQDEASEVE